MQKTEAHNKGYQEMLKKGEVDDDDERADAEELSGKGVIRCTQCLQVGHMRTNRSCPLYMADEANTKKPEKQVNAVLAENVKNT